MASSLHSDSSHMPSQSSESRTPCTCSCHHLQTVQHRYLVIITILDYIVNSICTCRDPRTDAPPSNASATASWYFHELLMKMWMSSTQYLQQRFPPGSIEYGEDIIYLQMHTNPIIITIMCKILSHLLTQ